MLAVMLIQWLQNFMGQWPEMSIRVELLTWVDMTWQSLLFFPTKNKGKRLILWGLFTRGKLGFHFVREGKLLVAMEFPPQFNECVKIPLCIEYPITCKDKNSILLKHDWLMKLISEKSSNWTFYVLCTIHIIKTCSKSIGAFIIHLCSYTVFGS